MSTVIKLKRGTSTPTTSNIVDGEVAVDTSAQKLYINDNGTVKEIGGGSSSAGAVDEVMFNEVTSDPTVSAGEVALYYKTPTVGEDGFYLKTDSGTVEQLILKKKAITYSLIF